MPRATPRELAIQRLAAITEPVDGWDLLAAFGAGVSQRLHMMRRLREQHGAECDFESEIDRMQTCIEVLLEAEQRRRALKDLDENRYRRRALGRDESS